ncbi:hypothetical protein [Escherichia coli]|uniref:hypothetical protein n=1 Tax=Escherichia coli TaxID=562 RepID=UPI001E5213AF|nr:hypothetical protein [Escherichia coli]
MSLAAPIRDPIMNIIARFFYLIIFCMATSGCTTTTKINRGDEKEQYIIACGAATPWGLCYDKANALCKNGYKDLLKEQGFNRKELTIECK